MLLSTQLCIFVVPPGLVMATKAQNLSASGGSNILCLESSTTVESPLQISSFLTNKPNFPDNQMNVNKVITKDYENIANRKLCENKANTNPISKGESS